MLSSYVDFALTRGASDLHFSVGVPAFVRVDSGLLAYDAKPLSSKQVASIVSELTSDAQRKRLKKEREIDLSYAYNSHSRFRVNIFFEQGSYAIAMRHISREVPTLYELDLPEMLLDFTQFSQGLILVVGPTGHGKTTTIASLIDYINSEYGLHIVTIEDPIEYVFEQKQCVIAQREVGTDTLSFENGLVSCLRQDPDVVFVGEMRNFETVSAAVTLAETGHLVFSTLHTNDAAQTIDRIIDIFPAEQQNQIRTQLANTLVGVVSQRLIPRSDESGRAPAVEILRVNAAASNLIRENKTHLIPNIIQTSKDEGMVSLNSSLADLVTNDVISEDSAFLYTLDPGGLEDLL